MKRRFKIAGMAAAALVLALALGFSALWATDTVVHSKWSGSSLVFYSGSTTLMTISSTGVSIPTLSVTAQTLTAPVTINGGTSGSLPLSIPSAAGTPAALNLPLVSAGDTLVARTTTDTLTNKTLTDPVLGSTAGSTTTLHHAAFVRITASLCSTGGGIGATCAEPTVSGLPFTDTSYSVACTCVGTPTGVPVVLNVAKTAASAGLASQAVVTIAAVSSQTASCVELDCNFWE